MILIDTHVILWLALSPERISTKARKYIEECREEQSAICISPISLYEIGFVASRNRVHLNIPLESFLDRVVSFFTMKPISARIAVEAIRFPAPFPGDPMDRIITATALTEGIPLVTADERIRRSGIVKTIW